VETIDEYANDAAGDAPLVKSLCYKIKHRFAIQEVATKKAGGEKLPSKKQDHDGIKAEISKLKSDLQKTLAEQEETLFSKDFITMDASKVQADEISQEAKCVVQPLLDAIVAAAFDEAAAFEKAAVKAKTEERKWRRQAIVESLRSGEVKIPRASTPFPTPPHPPPRRRLAPLLKTHVGSDLTVNDKIKKFFRSMNEEEEEGDSDTNSDWTEIVAPSVATHSAHSGAVAWPGAAAGKSKRLRKRGRVEHADTAARIAKQPRTAQTAVAENVTTEKLSVLSASTVELPALFREPTQPFLEDEEDQIPMGIEEEEADEDNAGDANKDDAATEVYESNEKQPSTETKEVQTEDVARSEAEVQTAMETADLEVQAHVAGQDASAQTDTLEQSPMGVCVRFLDEGFCLIEKLAPKLTKHFKTPIISLELLKNAEGQRFGFFATFEKMSDDGLMDKANSFLRQAFRSFNPYQELADVQVCAKDAIREEESDDVTNQRTLLLPVVKIAMDFGCDLKQAAKEHSDDYGCRSRRRYDRYHYHHHDDDDDDDDLDFNCDCGECLSQGLESMDTSRYANQVSQVLNQTFHSGQPLQQVMEGFKVIMRSLIRLGDEDSNYEVLKENADKDLARFLITQTYGGGGETREVMSVLQQFFAQDPLQNDWTMEEFAPYAAGWTNVDRIVNGTDDAINFEPKWASEIRYGVMITNGDLERAAKLVKKQGNLEYLLQILVASGKYDEAYEECVKRGDSGGRKADLEALVEIAVNGLPIRVERFHQLVDICHRLRGDADKLKRVYPLFAKFAATHSFCKEVPDRIKRDFEQAMNRAGYLYGSTDRAKFFRKVGDWISAGGGGDDQDQQPPLEEIVSELSVSCLILAAKLVGDDLDQAIQGAFPDADHDSSAGLELVTWKVNLHLKQDDIERQVDMWLELLNSKTTAGSLDLVFTACAHFPTRLDDKYKLMLTFLTAIDQDNNNDADVPSIAMDIFRVRIAKSIIRSVFNVQPTTSGVVVGGAARGAVVGVEVIASGHAGSSSGTSPLEMARDALRRALKYKASFGEIIKFFVENSSRLPSILLVQDLKQGLVKFPKLKDAFVDLLMVLMKAQSAMDFGQLVSLMLEYHEATLPELIKYLGEKLDGGDGGQEFERVANAFQVLVRFLQTADNAAAAKQHLLEAQNRIINALPKKPLHFAKVLRSLVDGGDGSGGNPSKCAKPDVQRLIYVVERLLRGGGGQGVGSGATGGVLTCVPIGVLTGVPTDVPSSSVPTGQVYQAIDELWELVKSASSGYGEAERQEFRTRCETALLVFLGRATMLPDLEAVKTLLFTCNFALNSDHCLKTCMEYLKQKITALKTKEWVGIFQGLRDKSLSPLSGNLASESYGLMAVLMSSLDGKVRNLLSKQQLNTGTWSRDVSGIESFKCPSGSCAGCPMLFDFLKNARQQESNLTVNDVGRKCIQRILNKSVGKQVVSNMMQVTHRFVHHTENKVRNCGAIGVKKLRMTESGENAHLSRLLPLQEQLQRIVTELGGLVHLRRANQMNAAAAARVKEEPGSSSRSNGHVVTIPVMQQRNNRAAADSSSTTASTVSNQSLAADDVTPGQQQQGRAAVVVIGDVIVID